MSIYYKLIETKLGRALLAETAKPAGVCYLSFPGLCDDARAEQEFLEKFEGAVRVGETLQFEPLIVKALNGEDVSEDIGVNLIGSEFNVSVWKQLMKIPYGHTASYAEIAKAIGRPTASRAVAMACSRNRVAVIVPCHRVIASNGSLSGFGWGVENKKMLLAREGVTQFT